MKSVFTLFLLFVFSFSFCQIIPTERVVDWSVAGVETDFDDPDIMLNVMNFGAIGDGVTDDSDAVISAIAALNGDPGIVFFPEGDFLIKSTISLHSGVIIRGVDSLSTKILIDFDGAATNVFQMYGAAAFSFIPVADGYYFNSDFIVAPENTNVIEGDYVEMVQDNGSWDVVPADWAENVVGQIIRITDVVDDTLFFEYPLRISFSEVLNPRIRKIIPIQNCAIENLKMIRLDEPVEGAGSNISISFAVNCRVSAVESFKSVGSHVAISNSSQIKISDSYFHHAFTYDGSGTRGYGVTLSMHSGECLIVDNIFEHLRHAMMVKTGSNGNVFSYNYSIDPYRSETINDFSGDISLHGHYAYANLFEGNIAQNIIIDHYWGPSGPLNTFFRNRAELYGFITTSADLQTSQMNIVGQEITNTDFLYGMYQIFGENHFEYGNYVKGDILPFYTNDLPDSSYYLIEKPDFWHIPQQWPSIGIPYEIGEGTNPAKERYFGFSTSVISFSDGCLLKIYPNPVKNYFILEGCSFKNILLKITALNGKCVFEKRLLSDVNSITINIADNITNGVYVLSLVSDSSCLSKKIVIQK